MRVLNSRFLQDTKGEVQITNPSSLNGSLDEKFIGSTFQAGPDATGIQILNGKNVGITDSYFEFGAGSSPTDSYAIDCPGTAINCEGISIIGNIFSAQSGGTAKPDAVIHSALSTATMTIVGNSVLENTNALGTWNFLKNDAGFQFDVIGNTFNTTDVPSAVAGGTNAFTNANEHGNTNKNGLMSPAHFAQGFSALISPILKPATDSTTALQLQTSGGTSVLDIDTSNLRVGVNSTGPAASLQVASAGNSASNYTARFQSSASVGGAGGILFDQNSTNSFKVYTSGTTGSSGKLVWQYITESNGTVLNDNILAFEAGNVGIGTNAPALQLDVAKAMRTHLNDQGSVSGNVTFDASLGNTQKITLGGDVTSSLTNCASGQWLVLDIIQNSSSAKSFAWPTTGMQFLNHGTIGTSTTARHNIQTFYCDGTNARAASMMLINQN